jgi:hypothetical protein
MYILLGVVLVLFYVVLGWSMSYCMQHKKLDDVVCTENSKFKIQPTTTNDDLVLW